MQYKDINDYEVLYLIGENQLEEKDIIFKKYKPILISISQKYYMRLRDKKIEYDDLYQEAMIGLNYAIDHFKEQKNNIFYSYAVLCISSRLKTYVNSYLNSKNKFLNDSISLDDDSDNNLDSVSSIRFCDNFIYFYERLINFKNNLDNKKSQVFELKYNGFSEFMQDLFDYTDGRKSLSKKLTGHIFENIAFFSKELNDLGKTQEDVYDVKIASTFLGYKLRFPMKDEIDDEPGVDLYTALDMLHYVTIPENLTIYKKRSNLYGTYSTEYNHIMFQARDTNPVYKDLGFDIMLYYTVDIEDEDKKDFVNRKIDIESMEYELGEEKSLEEKAEDEEKKK